MQRSQLNSTEEQSKSQSSLRRSLLDGLRLPQIHFLLEDDLMQNANLQQGQSTQKLAAVYCRFSSDKQDEKSNQDQLVECRKKILELGFTNPEELAFADEAISGQSRNRPGLKSLMEGARLEQYELLVVFSISRLARDHLFTIETLRELVDRHGIRVISVSEGIDSSMSTWNMIVPFLSIFHEHYVKELGKNVLRGQSGNAREDCSNGDRCIGYQSVPCPQGRTRTKGGIIVPKKVIVIDEDQANTVRLIFQMYTVEKLSRTKIVHRLNQLNLPKDHRSTTEGWHPSLVRRILRNRKYIGEWKWGKKKNIRDPLTGKVVQKSREEDDDQVIVRERPDLAFISKEQFQKAQQLLDIAKAAYLRNKKNGQFAHPNFHLYPQYLLSHRMVCGNCGSLMIITGHKRRFFCCKNSRKGLCDCRTTLEFYMATKMVLDHIMSEIVQNDLLIQSIQNAVSQRLRDHSESLDNGKLLERKKKERELLKGKIQKLIDLIEESKGDEIDDLRLRRKQRKSELHQVEADIELLESQSSIILPEPTREWVISQLKESHELLAANNTQGSELLKTLLDGPIILREIKEPGRKRHYFRAKMRIHSFQLLNSAIGSIGLNDDDKPQYVIEPKEIHFDCVAPNPTHVQIQKFKELFDQGLLMKEIALKLGVSRSRISNLKKQAESYYDVKFKDCRTRRSTLDCKHIIPPVYQQLAEPANKLCDHGLTNTEIAKELGVDVNTITKSLKHWYKVHNLPFEDGRTRYAKSLKNKPAA
jgi:DNA invertase Pin-like site-specific DNA recombinase